MKQKDTELPEWQMSPFIAKQMLDLKKEDYKKLYYITESLNSMKFAFIDRKTHTFNRTLIYSGKDNIYFDTKRKKNVNENTSAFVLLIIERQRKRSYVPIAGWSTKGDKKCRTRIIAVPKDRKEIQYTFQYVLEHPDEFELFHQCKTFTSKGTTIFTTPVINNTDREQRAISVYLMRHNKIPIKTISKIHNISVRQSWKDVKTGKMLLVRKHACHLNLDRIRKKYRKDAKVTKTT